MTNLRRILPTLTASLGVAVGLVALAPNPSHAQEPRVFGEILDVRVVNVEVVVTDRDGVRVRGLGPEAFRLFVDGEEQPIEYFTEVRGGTAVPAGSGQSVAGIQVPSVRPGEAVGNSYLVFVDELFSIDRDRDRVLESLREQLNYLGPNDRMAVVAFDGRRVEMLSSWSQSPVALDRVLKEAQRRPAWGMQRRAEIHQIEQLRQDYRTLGRFVGSRGRNGSYELDPQYLSFAQQLEEQLDRSVRAASSTLRSFAQPPGRKVMLLLSGGWPNSPAQYVINNTTTPIIDTRIKEGAELFRPLADVANLLGYTVYPIDVPGLGHDTTLGDASLRDPVDTGFSFRETDTHQTLRYLAAKTGGEPFINSDRLLAMEEVHNDTKSYYWLGFTPQMKGDDVPRDVRVQLATRGLKARYRDGFQDFSRSTEVTMAVESALLFGSPPNAAGLDVSFGESKRSGVGKIEVPLSVEIPLDLVTIVPYGDGFVGEVELRVAVQDEHGATAPIPVVPLRISLDEEPAVGTFGSWQTSLKLRKVKHDVVVALYDMASGNMVSTSTVLSP